MSLAFFFTTFPSLEHIPLLEHSSLTVLTCDVKSSFSLFLPPLVFTTQRRRKRIIGGSAKVSYPSSQSLMCMCIGSWGWFMNWLTDWSLPPSLWPSIHATAGVSHSSILSDVTLWNPISPCVSVYFLFLCASFLSVRLTLSLFVHSNETPHNHTTILVGKRLPYRHWSWCRVV